MSASPSPERFDPLVVSPRPLRVLVADDELVIRRTLAMMLERKGHRVEVADSADQALASLSEGLPDVALVDWKMPGSGEVVVQTLLARPEFRGTVFLVTGSMDDEASPFEDRGVIRVRKPFSYPRLVDMVEGAGPAANPPTGASAD